MLLAVNTGEVATPDAFVKTVTKLTPPAKLALGPVTGAAKVTDTPFTGLPPASFTVAESGEAKAVFVGALWPLPLVTSMEAGVPAVLVSENVVLRFATTALTLYAPAIPFAVKTGDVAMPDAFVVAVAVVPAPANVPLAPLPGAVNVTVTPLTGFPPLFLTIALNGAANAVLMAVVCPLPDDTAMDEAVPAVMVTFVMADVKPFADAVTTVEPCCTPVTWAVPVLPPVATKTLGVTVAFVGLLLTSVMVTPPAGAPRGKVIVNDTDCPAGTDRAAGALSWPSAATVTVALVSARFGKPLACTVVDPAFKPLTGTLTVVAPGPKNTFWGTPTTVGSAALTLMNMPPPGAGADKVSVKFFVSEVPIVNV